jgi:HSP20 family protein
MFATLHVPSLASRGWDPFEQARREFARGVVKNGSGQPRQPALAPLSAWEDEQQLYVEVDLPGLQPQDVDVTVEKDKLFIRGERAPAGTAPRHDERAYGKFERIVALADTIDPSRIDASLQDGVLRLTLHKRPEVLPQKVTVKYDAGAAAVPNT